VEFIKYKPLLEEKVNRLINFEKRTNENFLIEKIKCHNFAKILKTKIERIDQILSDRVILYIS
jgi:hypothetical protein